MASNDCRTCNTPMTSMSARCPSCHAWFPMRGMLNYQTAAIVFLLVVFVTAFVLLIGWGVPSLPVNR